MKLGISTCGATALTLAVMLLARVAQAEPADAGVPAWLAQNPALETPSSSSLPVGRMLALFALTAALGGGAWYARKRRLGSATGAGQQRLKVLDTARLGPKGSLVIVSVNGKMMLLGVTEASITRLAWTEDERPPQEPAEQPAQDTAPQEPFSGMLRSLLESRVEPRSEESVSPPPSRRELPLRAVPQVLQEIPRSLPAEQTESLEAVEGQAAGLSARRSRRRR